MPFRGPVKYCLADFLRWRRGGASPKSGQNIFRKGGREQQFRQKAEGSTKKYMTREEKNFEPKILSPTRAHIKKMLFTKKSGVEAQNPASAMAKIICIGSKAQMSWIIFQRVIQLNCSSQSRQHDTSIYFQIRHFF